MEQIIFSPFAPIILGIVALCGYCVYDAFRKLGESVSLEDELMQQMFTDVP